MENHAYVCTFDSKQSDLYDYIKTISVFRLAKNLFIAISPLCVGIFIISIFLRNLSLIVISMVLLALILCYIFSMQKFYAKRFIAYRKKLYGKEDIEEKIVFGDKIIITAGENRTVLEYSSISKIVVSGNIYALFLTGSNGIYFPKNSCADATGDELLAMLVERTGAKIKGRSKLAIVITVLATAAVAIYSALWAYSIFISIY